MRLGFGGARGAWFEFAAQRERERQATVEVFYLCCVSASVLDWERGWMRKLGAGIMVKRSVDDIVRDW